MQMEKSPLLGKLLLAIVVGIVMALMLLLSTGSIINAVLMYISAGSITLLTVAIFSHDSKPNK